MTVTEITYAVGSSDLKHFRSVFREHSLGTIPTQFWHDTPATIIRGFGILGG
jgi:hypothetical protein